MQALAVTPARPSTVVSAPTQLLPGSCSHSMPAYTAATCENAANASTDGAVYSQLLAQIGDPNGTAFSISTSLSEAPIAVTGANLATLTTRFVYPQFSLEGKRLWIVGMAPRGIIEFPP